MSAMSGLGGVDAVTPALATVADAPSAVHATDARIPTVRTANRIMRPTLGALLGPVMGGSTERARQDSNL